MHSRMRRLIRFQSIDTKDNSQVAESTFLSDILKKLLKSSPKAIFSSEYTYTFEWRMYFNTFFALAVSEVRTFFDHPC